MDLHSNVQFGEGGAGTFSDGKLTSRSKNPLGHKVNEIFAAHGAPEGNHLPSQPYIGTEPFGGVIVSMREQMIHEGAEVRFGVTVQSLILEDGLDGKHVKGVMTSAGAFYSNGVILALGHSSRDLFRTLHTQGLHGSQAFCDGLSYRTSSAHD